MTNLRALPNPPPKKTMPILLKSMNTNIGFEVYIYQINIKKAESL
jgi:hypothetical protein